MKQLHRRSIVPFLSLLVIAGPGCIGDPLIAEDTSPEVESSEEALSTGVLVYLREEGLTSSNETKPRFYVKNATANTLRNLEFSYYVTTDPGKTPVLEDWYTPGCDVALEGLGGLSFRIHFRCPSVVLRPGQAMPDTVGYAVGLHYSDWSAWNKNDDYSYNASATHALTDRIVVESGGTILAGSPPPSPTPPAPLPLAWQQTPGGANADYAEDVVEAANGGLVLAGWTNSIGTTPGTYDDAWLVKTDALGKPVWQRTFGGASYDRFHSVRATQDGGLVAVGYTNQPGASGQGNDIFLVKTDGAGTLVFQQTFGGTKFEDGAAVRETSDGGFVIVGNAQWAAGPRTIYSDVVLLRTDAAGNQLWMQTFGQPSAWNSGYSVAELASGGFVVAAEERGNAVLVATDSAGNVAWTRTLGPGLAKSVLVAADGGFLVLGQGPGTTGSTDLWLVKTDASGATLWTRSYASTTEELARDLRPTGQGTYLVLGWQVVPRTGPFYPRLMEVDDAGAPLWSQQFGDGSFRVGSAALTTARGGHLVAGYTGGSGSDAWLAKLGNEQLIDVILPPSLGWCDSACQSALRMPVVYACPRSDPTCTPTRSTTIVFSVNGRRVNGQYMPVLAASNGALMSVRVASQGSGATSPKGAGYVTQGVPGVILYSDEEIKLTWSYLPPVWGGTFSVDFVAAGLSSAEMNSFFFRFPHEDSGDAALDLLARSIPVITQEKAITQVQPPLAQALYMPAELSAIISEGNVSYGGGIMTVDTFNGYGERAIWELSHEWAHEQFRVNMSSYQGGVSCLNEGQADYLGNLIGAIPDSHLPPKGDCQAESGNYAIGECYFSHVKEAGLLDAAFMRGIHNPPRTYNFDSCDPTSSVTGNSLVVLFSEAAGQDMAAVVTAMNVPNAGSYVAAAAALWP